MSDELAGGRWVNRRGVRVWIAAKPIPLSTVRERPKSPLFNTRLIACPCGATVVQTCRTKGGNPTTDHAERVVSRRCICGDLLAWKKTYCEECRKEQLRQAYRLREIRQPTKLRRREAS